MQRYEDFEAAAQAVLEFLHSRLPFDLWMVTRVEGDDWIVLVAEDHGYNVEPGTIFAWTESFCHRMVRGEGPCVAPRSDIVLPYASAPIGRKITIGAYMGAPILHADGSLFGTLCAIHPTPQPDSILAQQDLLELLAGMLSSLLPARADQRRGAGVG